MLKPLILAWIWIQIRALEATAQGQQEVIELLRDQETLDKVCVANLTTLAEIDRLKAEYRRVRRGNGLRPVGV